MGKVIPIRPIASTENHLRPGQDAPKMTVQRAIEHIKQFDPSTVVNLNSNKLPAFLYNKTGKLEKG